MVKALTRSVIAGSIYRELGFLRSEVSDLVDAMIEEIVLALEEGDDVKLSSFGTFHVRHKKERIGRNPKTKEEIPISARRVVGFHASSLLVKRINSQTRRES